MSDDALIVRTSPFHDRTSLACVTNSWTTIAGTTFVSVYRNVEQEYWSMYKAAGVADISYSFAIRVAGAQAADALDHLTVARIHDLAPGTYSHTLWCSEEGFVVGDGLLLCEDVQSFVLMTRVPCLAFVTDTCAAFDCAVTRADDLEAGLEIIGPAASAILEGAGFSWAPALHPGSCVSMSVRGLNVKIARFERSGASGYAIWTAGEGAPRLWDRLRRAGAASGLMAVGTAAHTILRLEAGEPAYGLDYVGALVAPSWHLMATPRALGWGTRVATDKTLFNGASALAKAAPPRRHLATLAVEGTGMLAPAFVTSDGLPVGHVTSAAWSPRLGCGLVMAWLEGEKLSPNKALRLVSPVRSAAGELTDMIRDGRLCHLYSPA